MNDLHTYRGESAAYFKDRRDAGRKLAGALLEYKKKNAVVLGLPRGGVPVAFEVCRFLSLPLNIIVTRKIGAPHNPEFGIGAISENGAMYMDLDTIAALGGPTNEIEKTIIKEKQELQRRVEKYRSDTPLPKLDGKTAILVDDGLATGVTALAAIKATKKLDPAKIIFAVPVCAYETGKMIATQVHEFICLHSPSDLRTIGNYYDDFEQITDERATKLLGKALGT